MDCTTTFIKRTRSQGFTLPEMLVGIGISGILFTIVASLVFYSGRSFAAITNYVDLDSKSRNALDRMSQEIRQADAVISGSTNRLDFSGSGSTFSYIFNPTDKTLIRRQSGQADQVLLTRCDGYFSMFQRNIVEGSYTNYPTDNPNECKMVQLSWVCSRDVVGTANTESVQSAKVVIRKQ